MHAAESSCARMVKPAKPPTFPPETQFRMIYHGMCLLGRYEIRRLLGKGAMGDIWEALDLQSKESVAIKLVKSSDEPAQHGKTINELVVELHRENVEHMYVSSRSARVPQHVDWHIDEKSGPFIVMQMLGSDLGFVRNKTRHKHKKMSIASVCRLGRGALECLNEIHRAGYVHRDLKPQNFLLGPLGTETELDVFMVDFGFVKRHLNPKTKKPVPAENRPNFRGTAPYSSIRAQQFQDQGRRDDLEGLFFVLAELMLGGLPWTKVANEEGDKRKRDKMILAQKMDFTAGAKVLFDDPASHTTKACGAFCGPTGRRIAEVPPGEAAQYLPHRLLRFLIDVHRLKYHSVPDYATLRGYLRDTELEFREPLSTYFKLDDWEDAFKMEVLVPLQKDYIQHDVDCVDFWCSGVCYDRRCRKQHVRTAAPDFLLNAFRCKRNRENDGLGDETTGPPPTRAITVFTPESHKRRREE